MAWIPIGSSYERDCYLRVYLESQTTNPSQQRGRHGAAVWAPRPLVVGTAWCAATRRCRSLCECCFMWRQRSLMQCDFRYEQNLDMFEMIVYGFYHGKSPWKTTTSWLFLPKHPTCQLIAVWGSRKKFVRFSVHCGKWFPTNMTMEKTTVWRCMSN